VVNYDDALAEPELLLASAGIDKRREFAKRTNAVTVLEGTIYRQGDRLLFEAHIYNLESGDRLKAFEIVECNINDPMQGISDLGNKILGWWATKNDIVYSVPNYQAYQLYLEARNVWKEDVIVAEAKLKESIAADTTFIDPYFLITELYSNRSDYSQRDSVLALIKKRFNQLTPRQRSLLDVYEANARGDLIQTYQNYLTELNSDPLDVFVNTAGMVQALQYANKPRMALHWFGMIPLESMNMDECAYCQTRLRLATIAYLKVGKIDSAIYTSSLLPPDSEINMSYKLKPLVVLNDSAKINHLIADFNQTENASSKLNLYLEMARRFYLLDRNDLVKHYSDLALAGLENPNVTNGITVESNYLLGNYKKVIQLVESVWPLSEYPTNEYVLIWTSRAYAQAGDDADRARVSQLIKDADKSEAYNYGRGPYLLAVMAVIEGKNAEALTLLKEAYNEGYQFSEFRYQNDIDLMPLFNDPAFNQLISPLD
jgi:hypothetical protein